MGLVEIMRVYMGSTESERNWGLTAYQVYQDKIRYLAESYRFDRLDLACGMFSALSPNNAEKQNFEDLRRMLKARSRGTPMHLVRTSAYPLNRTKAVSIMEGADPEQVLGGRKTLNFYRCLIHPEDPEPVVVDGHIYSVWMGKYHRMRDADVTDLRYSQIETDFKYVAGRVNLIPSQLQATCWIAWKREHHVLAQGLDRGRQMLLDFMG